MLGGQLGLGLGGLRAVGLGVGFYRGEVGGS
jgi:hypothetical protein